jgi:hypothetical protein
VEAEAANDQLGSIDGAALTMELDANYDNLGTVPWHFRYISRSRY